MADSTGFQALFTHCWWKRNIPGRLTQANPALWLEEPRSFLSWGEAAEKVVREH